MITKQANQTETRFHSVNPFSGEVLSEHLGLNERKLASILDRSATSFRTWKMVPLAERCALIATAAGVLRRRREEFARTITLEMGKPISEALAEVDKCAWVCEYYAEKAPEFLQSEIVKTEASESFVSHEPIGAVFAVMPWNFPFWQVFRFAAPTLTAGNTGLLKHAPNVFGCAKHIEEVFQEAGFPEGVFRSLIIHHDRSEQVIAHPSVRAVTLTGSERAGMAVAQLAGRYLKKSLLELGGSNAFIVWEDANLDHAVDIGVRSRMLNAGQSCIAAKRFILVDGIYDEFVDRFARAASTWKTGDPLHETTQLGPMARIDLAEQLQEQLHASLELGAELHCGGRQSGAFHEATVLTDVRPSMPAFHQETFGPLAAMIRAKNVDEAFTLAEKSLYGLGVTVCTTDTERARQMISRVSDGAYFVNELVKSDPRLPFGGTKISGYGRELAKDGMMEFVNRKTVYINDLR